MRVSGHQVHLTHTEFRLLVELASNRTGSSAEKSSSKLSGTTDTWETAAWSTSM